MAKITEEQILIAQLTTQLLIAKRVNIPVHEIQKIDIQRTMQDAVNIVIGAKTYKHEL